MGSGGAIAFTFSLLLPFVMVKTALAHPHLTLFFPLSFLLLLKRFNWIFNFI